MNNYPPGTSHKDKNAPWNQPDIKIIECPDCNGKGWKYIDQEDYECETCDNSGEIEDDENLEE